MMNAIEVNELKTVLGFREGANEELDEILKRCEAGDFLSRIVFVLSKDNQSYAGFIGNYQGIAEMQKREAEKGGDADSELFIQFTENSNVLDIPKVQLREKTIKSNFSSSYKELKDKEPRIGGKEGKVLFSEEYHSMIKDKFNDEIKDDKAITITQSQIEQGENRPKPVEHQIEQIEPRTYQKGQFNKNNQKQKKGKNKLIASQQYPQNQGEIEQDYAQGQGHGQEQYRKKRKNKNSSNYY